jgi:hypothetical protein
MTPDGDTERARALEFCAAQIAKHDGLRSRIMAALDEIVGLSNRLTGFENLFLTHVLLPGYQLQLTIQKRRYLEREYHRIRAALEGGEPLGAEEREAEVRHILRHAEVAFAYQESDAAEDGLRAMSPTAPAEAFEPEDDLDEAARQELLREFRRCVIPKVHADTSDAPFEVFNVVYDAYKKRDFLLMEAFLVRYRGPFEAAPESDPAETLRLLEQRLARYAALLEKLESRLRRLRSELSTDQFRNAEALELQLRRQNREIRKAIFDEAEQILHLRTWLEDLARERH